MAILTPKQLCQVTQLGTTISTIYTVPSATSTIVKQILIANVTSTAATATVHFVPSAGSASSSNKIFGEITISANSTQVIDLSTILPTGATIQALAGAANSINIHASGVEDS